MSTAQPASVVLPSYSISGGLWRTDAGFSSTIQLKNQLVTMPIAVTPALFMADGTEYDLPVVDLPASGGATIDVKTALASAPAAIANHLSDYGSATLRYNGIQSALMGQTALGSTALSESFLSRFTSVMPGSPANQTLEGLWWARDAGIGGFVGLSNAADQPRTVTLRALTAVGQLLPAQSFILAPHASQMLDFLSLIGHGLTGGDAGGLRIQFDGLLGDVNVTGGLENRQEGYSAIMPFWEAPVAGMNMPSSETTIAHPGIMVGGADTMMGFPAGTRFTPYLALRNLTGSAQQVNLTLYTEQGTALTAPAHSLQPFESRQVNMNGILQELGLKGFNGALTLAVSHSGGPTDVMSAAGSVDAKGTYVFEVDGRAAEQKLSKQSPYWSVKNGNDTMVALWNPSASAEDVMVTLKYAGGSGNYHFRVHLAPHATANLDVKELIANQSRDEEGNMLPLDLQEGSLVFHSAKAVHAPLSLNVNVGIYDVAKGTCYYGTVTCDGYFGVTVTPATSSIASFGGWVGSLTAYGQYSNGTNLVVGASWSSSNTGVATVNGGDITGVVVGQATITASADLLRAGSYSGYNPSCSTLQPTNTFSGTATVNVGDTTPVITGMYPSNWVAGTTTTLVLLGQSFGTHAPVLSFSPAAGISYALAAYNNGYIRATVNVAAGTPNETVNVTVTSSGYTGQGFSNGGNGQSSHSLPATAAVVNAPVSNTRITVVAWLDANAVTLPTGENTSLQSDLNNQALCVFDVLQWTNKNRFDVYNVADTAYANAFLLKHSGNSQPPLILPAGYLGAGDFRLYNDYGSPAGGVYEVGITPSPCGTGPSGVIRNWTQGGERSLYNGATGKSPSGQTYQLTEGRLGLVGQAVNQTLNGRSSPWIWTVIEFNSSGIPTYTDHGMFPTYWVYTNGSITAQYPQSAVTPFMANDGSYQRTPSQIQ